MAPPRGRPKSGRLWKTPKQRARLLIAVKPWRKTWSKHEEERYDKKKLKELEQDLKLKAKQEKDERNRKIVERRRIKEENRKKSEIVQKITNPAKLRRLKKKQIKGIQKR